MSVLEVEGLAITVAGRAVVEDVSFRLEPGRALGLVGESGSGKTLTARALLDLLPERVAEIRGGRILLDGVDLIAGPKRRWKKARGAEIGMVFQEPMTALDPVFTVGQQIVETLAAHGRHDKKNRRAQAIELLRQVGIPAPESRIDDYPHQLSGGMRQRVLIALALCLGPKVLICDEPTSALDVTVQAQILELLRSVMRERQTAILFITHDLAVVNDIADRLLVMYAGQIVEAGPTAEILGAPKHHYTRGLLDSLPRAGQPLRPIPGGLPPIDRRPSGCRFHPRCGRAEDRCKSEAPPLEGVERAVRCFFPIEGQR